MVKSLVIYADGRARPNPGPAAVGIVIQGQAGEIVKEISQRIGKATSNQAEYRALILGLEEAGKLGAVHLDIRLDSELLVRQIKGQYRVKNAELKPLFQRVNQLFSKFRSVQIEHIPREQNRVADALARKGWESDD